MEKLNILRILMKQPSRSNEYCDNLKKKCNDRFGRFSIFRHKVGRFVTVTFR